MADLLKTAAAILKLGIGNDLTEVQVLDDPKVVNLTLSLRNAEDVRLVKKLERALSGDTVYCTDTEHELVTQALTHVGQTTNRVSKLTGVITCELCHETMNNDDFPSHLE